MTAVALPATASETSADAPWPLRLLAAKLSSYVDRSPSLWVEAQLVEAKRRPGTRSVFVTLRDTDADISMTAVVDSTMLDRAGRAVADGARVIVLVQPQFYAKRGSLTLAVRQIRAVGMGELLVRIEALKEMLRAEGLFDADRKLPLPFLPQCVGLVCGRGSAAERDVVDNARSRWPAVRFEIREVAVQGETAITAVGQALRQLDADSGVDVIVVARGGGSLEDLLPFSSEGLVRAVAACRTPVVSAIGHEVDSPLFDLVADVRASTPTDAARLVVPDVADQLDRVRNARARARQLVGERILTQRRHLADIRSRPVLSDPRSWLQGLRTDSADQRQRLSGEVRRRCTAEQRSLGHVRDHLRSLSPAATLERGYAIVRVAGDIVRDPLQAPTGADVTVSVALGTFTARSHGPAKPSTAQET